MRSLSVHPNHNIYIYILIFISLFYLFFYLKKNFFIQYKRREIAKSINKRKEENLILMIWFLEKSLIYLLKHCYLYQAMLILNTTLKKYIMIEKFKDELKDLKNILNKIKGLELLKEQEMNEIKKERKKLNMLGYETHDIFVRKVRCRFSNSKTKM